MKRLLLPLFIMLATITFGQTAAGEQITVNKADLPANVLKDLETKEKIQNVKETVADATEIAKGAKSIGHEIGIAVDEALGAVTKHANTFGKTDVGKFTMWMVAFAILKDQIPIFYETLLGTVFGIPFLIFMNCMLFWLYLKTTRQYKRITKDNGKAGKEYEWVDTWFTKADSETKGWFLFFYWVVVLVGNITTVSCVIF